ncbi:MAG: cytochrome P460 family protein [Gammaproteobacteria bacterium]
MRTSLIAFSCLAIATACTADSVPPSPVGIDFPAGYQDWRVISISHRIDNKTLRVILGNDTAIEASRAGKTNPWPDGSILGKVVWKEQAKPSWPAAIAPNELVHAEFMFKDAKKYAENGTGWGWARWVGMQQTPFGNDAKADQECIACHTPVKGNDWVFTTPAPLPPVQK